MFNLRKSISNSPRSSIRGILLLVCCVHSFSTFAQVILPPDPNATIPQQPTSTYTGPNIASSPMLLPPGGNPGMMQRQGTPQPPMSEILGEASLAPEKNIVRLAPLWPYYLAASVLTLIVLTALITWLMLKNRKPKPIPIIPADVRALSGLEALKPLIQEAKAREFSYQASEIIRGYIEDRFGMRARNKTTREFLNQSMHTETTLAEKHQASLQQFLQFCDLAKFAKHVLSPEQLNEMYQSATVFIKETRPSIMATSREHDSSQVKEVDVA